MSEGMFTVTGGTAFAGAGGAPRHEVKGMVVPFPNRATPATARASKSVGQEGGGGHCRVAARLCRSLHGANVVLHCIPATLLRSPPLTVNMP